MPTLLEVQEAVVRSLAQSDPAAAAGFIRDDGFTGPERLSIYRNTCIGSLATALRLAYPAVHRLVGAEFFDGAAHLFIADHPAAEACLDSYGAGFADFLAAWAPAASLPYLPDVARLERAVNSALHAADAPCVNLDRIAEVPVALRARVVLRPHPALGLVHVEHPADAIWRAVLDEDDEALARVDPAPAPAWLIVDRPEGCVELRRASRAGWTFTALLADGVCLGEALARAGDPDAAALLAEHFARGRFAAFDATGGAPGCLAS